MNSKNFSAAPYGQTDQQLVGRSGPLARNRTSADKMEAGQNSLDFMK
ncbi:MAG TPA: hypothetical protein VFU76_18345 [Terriglobales bacterium]|nr:hypothetical protein [Terriglobales bacterium]